MKLCYKNSVINLDNYDVVALRCCFIREGFTIDANRQMPGGGLFGGTTSATDEIAFFSERKQGEKALKAIIDAWQKNKEWFDLDAWLENNKLKGLESSNNV